MAVESAVRGVLKSDKNIVAAYIYGSFEKVGKSPEDIDVGVLVKDMSVVEKNAYFESDLALKIEKKLKIRMPVDVHVLNNAGIGFANQVLKYGKLIFSRNEKERVSFETRTVSKYFDFRPFQLEYERLRAQRLMNYEAG